jgi:adenylate cyclase
MKNGKGILTIKGASKDGGLSRDEWEKDLNREEAESLFKLVSGYVIEKIRYEIPWKNHIIEVDEFISPRKGLVLAEIELKDADDTPELPGWLGEEVTGKKEYYNAYMAQYG